LPVFKISGRITTYLTTKKDIKDNNPKFHLLERYRTFEEDKPMEDLTIPDEEEFKMLEEMREGQLKTQVVDGEREATMKVISDLMADVPKKKDTIKAADRPRISSNEKPKLSHAFSVPP